MLLLSEQLWLNLAAFFLWLPIFVFFFLVVFVQACPLGLPAFLEVTFECAFAFLWPPLRLLLLLSGFHISFLVTLMTVL